MQSGLFRGGLFGAFKNLRRQEYLRAYNQPLIITFLFSRGKQSTSLAT
jgi:hypothetical protein